MILRIICEKYGGYICISTYMHTYTYISIYVSIYTYIYIGYYNIAEYLLKSYHALCKINNVP